MKRNRPDPLAQYAQRNAVEPTPAEQLEEMQSQVRVLEHSINAQLGVAQAFAQGSTDYATAISIVESLKTQYFERRLDAVLLRMRLLFGDDTGLMVQQLEFYASHIEASLNQPPPTPPVQEDIEPEYTVKDVTDGVGTEVASDMEDAANVDLEEEKIN